MKLSLGEVQAETVLTSNKNVKRVCIGIVKGELAESAGKVTIEIDSKYNVTDKQIVNTAQSFINRINEQL